MQFSYLYILANANRTYLYIGFAQDLSFALEEHRQVACSAFSKEILPVHLLYFETFGNLALAESRSEEIKRWKDRQKWKLIMSANPCLSELLWLDCDTNAA